MEIIRKEDKKLIMSQHVGEATVTLESGEKVTYDLSATVNGSPIVTFQNGDYVIFSWEDIINLADKVNQMKQEPSEKEVFDTKQMSIFLEYVDQEAKKLGVPTLSDFEYKRMIEMYEMDYKK